MDRKIFICSQLECPHFHADWTVLGLHSRCDGNSKEILEKFGIELENKILSSFDMKNSFLIIFKPKMALKSFMIKFYCLKDTKLFSFEVFIGINNLN